ncbi:MAG TPA: hypothetical protein VLK29_12790 [Luteimonas sp.]|nr:hypothetical protein [Luteimonas sp.]
MKRVLMLGVMLAFAGAASAQAAVDEPEESGNGRASKARPDDRFCIQQTGSRVTAARHARSKGEQKDCVEAGGRVYTREDIHNSGSADIGDALRKLDPSIN